MAEGHSVTVHIEGEDASLHRAATRSAQDVRALDKAVGQTGESAQRTSAAITKTAKSTSNLGATMLKLKGDFNGALEIIKKATGFIDDIAASQVAAGQGTDVFTRSWLKMRAAMDDPKFFARISDGLADILAQLDPMQQLVNTLGTQGANGAKFLGDHRRGTGLRGLAIQGRRAATQLAGTQAQEQMAVQFGLLGSLRAGTSALDDYAKAHKRAAKAVKEDSEELRAFNRMAAEARNLPGVTREGSDTRDFESMAIGARNAAVGSQIRRRTPIDAAVQSQQSDAALAAQMRAIELARVQDEAGAHELEQIEQERSAKESFFREQAANTDDYITRLQALESIEQMNHDAKLARIEQERLARVKAQEQIANAIESTGSVIGSGARLAAMAAEATGASAKKQARVAQIGMGIQAMAIGALEVVKAAASYASLNIPQGIAHTAAAAVAFTEGGLLLAGKIGGSGGGASAGGRGMGGATSSSSGEQTKLPSGSDSPIPGSPGPQAPRTGGGTAPSSGGGVILDLRGANFYGTGGKKEFGRFVDEALTEAEQNRRARRSTG